MKSSIYLRWVAAWWLFFVAILIFGWQIKANAQINYGNPSQFLQIFRYLNITGQATTVVKSSPGVLHTICVNTPAATETITIYDNTAASGTKIGTITVFASTNPCLTYDVNFTTGLTIVTATANSDITVSYF